MGLTRVFDQGVLAVSYRKRRELNGHLILCSKIVLTDDHLYAYVQQKWRDILVLELPLDEVEVYEYDEVIVSSKDYVLTILRDQFSFQEYGLSLYEVAW